jgi:hypothetical protein
MTTTLLPTRTDYPHYAFDIKLDGTPYHFDFDWNHRDSSWTFSVSSIDGTPLVVGRKVVVGFPLLSRFKNPKLPPGVLLALDTSNAGVDPGETELGTRVQLVYMDKADLAEVQG